VNPQRSNRTPLITGHRVTKVPEMNNCCARKAATIKKLRKKLKAQSELLKAVKEGLDRLHAMRSVE
jgi:hypothetical protein